MLIFKELIPEVLAPYSIGLICLITGLAFLWRSRRQAVGKIFVSVGTFVLVFFGHALIWQSVLPPLEGRYGPLILEDNKQVIADNLGSVKWIVVLSGGYLDEQQLPIPDRLGHETLVLIEGIKAIPGSRLLLSGGVISTKISEAELMRKTAQVLGVDSRNVVLETQSQNTESEARLIRPIVGEDSFILVTSGFHMPRSMALFEREGLKPIPAPTGVRLKTRDRFGLHNFYPEAMHLVEAQNNFREYMGLAWLKLRGRI